MRTFFLSVSVLLPKRGGEIMFNRETSSWVRSLGKVRGLFELLDRSKNCKITLK